MPENSRKAKQMLTQYIKLPYAQVRTGYFDVYCTQYTYTVEHLYCGQENVCVLIRLISEVIINYCTQKSLGPQKL